MECNFLENSLKKYFEILSAKTPIPGGGSATGCIACLSLSLLNMVINYTIGKKGYEKYEEEIKRIKEENEKMLQECMEYIEEDSRIYQKIDRAMKEKENLEGYLKDSIFLHLKICEYMKKTVDFCDILVEKGNKNLISDTGISNIFAVGAFYGAKINIFINLKFMKDEDFKRQIKEKIEKMENDIEEKSELINRKVFEKMGV